jgi:predicted nucleic-acid-binding Zn-ribbon protein
MNPDGPCPKCGSKDCVPGARVFDPGSYRDLLVGVDRRPSAMLLKGKVITSLFAKVCGSCGFTELYARNPQAIHAAWLEAKRS